MLRETVADGVDPNTPAMMDLASLGGPKGRLLHPPPGRHPGHIDQPALANCPETGGRGQGRLQLRMDRDHPVLSPLALPDDQGRAVLIEVQVPGFQGQGFGHPRPARHCSSMINLALGLGAAAMRALTSSLSRYSGSLKPFSRGICCKLRPLELIPRGCLVLSAVVLMGPSATKAFLNCSFRGMSLTDYFVSTTP